MQKKNEDSIDWKEYDREPNRFRRKELSNSVGAEKLGFSLYELPPGKRSWPYHYHTANEEALYVLEGRGTLRHEDGEEKLRPGDFITLPDDESGGHQVANNGDDTLRYIVASTMEEPDVTVYPEMEKLGVFVGSPPGGHDERPLHGYYRTDEDVEYWED